VLGPAHQEFPGPQVAGRAEAIAASARAVANIRQSSKNVSRRQLRRIRYAVEAASQAPDMVRQMSAPEDAQLRGTQFFELWLNVCDGAALAAIASARASDLRTLEIPGWSWTEHSGSRNANPGAVRLRVPMAPCRERSGLVRKWLNRSPDSYSRPKPATRQLTTKLHPGSTTSPHLSGTHPQD